MRHAVPDPDEAPTEDLDRIDEVLARAGESVSGGGRESRVRPAVFAAGFALAVVVIAAIAAYLGAAAGYDRAARHTDGRIAALERDLAERRAVRADQDAVRDAQARRLLVLACVLLDHSQPRDSQIEAWRAELGCTGGPYVIPAPASGPRLPAPSSAMRPSGWLRTSGAVPPTPRPSSVIVAPSPAGPPPRPSPSQGGSPLLCVDLPLLPPVCV